MNATFQFECAACRRLVHAEADGEIDDAGRHQLDAHLSSCTECAEFVGDIAALRAGLAALPDPELPAADLAAVWARTVDATDPALPSYTEDTRRRAPLRWALAAAALALALLAPLALRERTAEPSAQELARAEADVRYVFGITDDALKRSGRIAVDEAVGRGVRPALRRVPMLERSITGGQ